MNLAPLANVVAYLDANPSRLAGMKEALGGRFHTVWSPTPESVMATRLLPRSVPDSDELRNAGVAFAEGRDAAAGRSVTELPVESLPGDVGFVRVDGDKLVVVRSGPGTVPWYAWQDRERVLVTTTFTELVRLLPVPVEFDPLVCALWANLQGMFPDGRSFLRGVSVIPPAHTAIVRRGGSVRSRRWWNPWPEELPWPSPRQRADHVERFRAAVLAALAREVADEPVNLLTLSGGVDSSTLAYLTVLHLGRPLAALSFVPPSNAPEARLEASYLDPLVADLGIDRHVRTTLDTARRAELFAGTPPVAFPVLHPALQVLPRLVPEWDLQVLVGGEWADEICGGWFAYADWLDSVSAFGLVRSSRALAKGRSDLRAWARRRIPGRLRPGPWPKSLNDCVRREVEEEYQSWRAAQLSVLRSTDAPHRYQLATLASQDGALAMNWEVCSFLRVRRAFPFLIAEVLEAVSACHPAEMLGLGPKRLERQAFAGLVPDRYLHRPDKSGWRDSDEDTPVDPPAVAASLNEAIRDDLGPIAPVHALGMMIASRFAERVGQWTGAGRHN